ncbi:hypothetical protein ART_3654 [Arthrobacter sp. PAMC 25486]|uniref:helix-turn-helix transcriptional regulator n=1 Tax=Arthrobacter sp. PAMC 25486 TaxID=1494608 RepID=UPI000535B242|nr:hypothetical protein ART_3654 [Arthrobacter sp. PAMC 25486]
MLAGVSVDYYTKRERGNFGSVSKSVLYALAQALQLNEPEREHLSHLAARTGTIKPGRRRAPQQTVRQSVQRVVDGLSDAPACVRNNSREFSSLWVAHDVRYHDTGSKTLHHPEVGDLELTFEVMDLPVGGQSRIVYGAEPGFSTEEALRLLSIGAATNEQQARVEAAELNS